MNNAFASLLCGVPLGSVLGPILFFRYKPITDNLFSYFYNIYYIYAPQESMQKSHQGSWELLLSGFLSGSWENGVQFWILALMVVPNHTSSDHQHSFFVQHFLIRFTKTKWDSQKSFQGVIEGKCPTTADPLHSVPVTLLFFILLIDLSNTEAKCFTQYHSKLCLHTADPQRHGIQKQQIPQSFNWPFRAESVTI